MLQQSISKERRESNKRRRRKELPNWRSIKHWWEILQNSNRSFCLEMKWCQIPVQRKKKTRPNILTVIAFGMLINWRRCNWMRSQSSASTSSWPAKGRQTSKTMTTLESKRILQDGHILTLSISISWNALLWSRSRIQSQLQPQSTSLV